jgi:hypothetical protein
VSEQPVVEPEVIDAQVIEEEPPTRAIEPAAAPTAVTVTPQVTAAELGERLALIEDAMNTTMKEGVDYGKVPGTDKPALFKSGSEKLSVLFRLDVQPRSAKTWGPGDHLTVETSATVYDIPTGTRIGFGEGLCTTREKKYGKRQASRICPSCGEAAIIKGKEEYGGGWVCYHKKGGCGAKYGDDDPLILDQSVGEIENPDLPDQWNCVTPSTRILTRDLRWVPAGEISTGEILIGVNEELPSKNGRFYEDAIATVGDRFTDELYEMRTEDGRVVRCNGEHRWLVKSVGSGVEWVTTEDIYKSLNGERRGRPRGWKIMEIGSPWEPEDSLEAGYLAGLLDADGSLDISRTVGPDGELLYHGIGVSFAQQVGGVLDRFIAGLSARGFAYGEYSHGNPTVRVPVTKLIVHGGFFEQLRFLGTIRPPRLLARWRDLVDLNRRRFEGRSVQVVSLTKVGPGELVRLGTSSRTYIAEGLVCHNTVVKMAEKRARVGAVLAVTGASAIFTQDLDEGADEGAEAPGLPVATEEQMGSLRAALDYILPSVEAKRVWGEITGSFGGGLYGPAADAVVAPIRALKAIRDDEQAGEKEAEADEQAQAEAGKTGEELRQEKAAAKAGQMAGEL